MNKIMTDVISKWKIFNKYEIIYVNLREKRCQIEEIDKQWYYLATSYYNNNTKKKEKLEHHAVNKKLQNSSDNDKNIVVLRFY